MLRRLAVLLVLGSTHAASAQQRIEPGNWFDVIDLPRPLLERLDRGGKVGLSVTVDPQGRAHDCTITTSSMIAELDTLTCDLVERRGRYIPATDAAGTAAAGRDRLSVDWRLLVPPSPMGWQMSPKAEKLLTARETFEGHGVAASGLVAVEIVAAASGKAIACKPTRSSGAPEFDQQLCRRILRLPTVTLPASESGSGGGQRRLGLEMTWARRPNGFSMATYPTTIVD